MTPSARLSAAIEILDAIAAERRPAADALKEWGLKHRFAGSGDRAAIAALVYDALRVKASSAFIMGAETGRALVLGMLKRTRHFTADGIATLCSGERFAPAPLSSEERAALDQDNLADAPAHVLGDYPSWLDPLFAAAFGEARAAELAAMTERAPVDLRVNTLKIDVDAVERELAHHHVRKTDIAPTGLRIALRDDGRAPAIQSDPAFLKGHIEVQDEGSQLVAQLCAPDTSMQVVDLCAGGGGKTLALAALMSNHGQIFATDSDTRRLAPIYDRLDRAGVRNVQVRSPKGKGDDPVSDLEGKADLVVVDAPCTGTGTWRRNPDAKWRVRPGALEQRQKEQAAVLDRAAGLVKKGGRIAYITCSLLPPENDDAVQGFLLRHPGFTLEAVDDVARRAGLGALANHRSIGGQGILLTPLRTKTDGFFFASLLRTD